MVPRQLSPQLPLRLMQGGKKLADGPVGDTHLRGLRDQHKGMLRTMGCVINDFLLPGLLWVTQERGQDYHCRKEKMQLAVTNLTKIDKRLFLQLFWTSSIYLHPF